MAKDDFTRRAYLEVLLATSAVASTTGCNAFQGTSNTGSTTDTPTATPNQAPQILAHDATPQNNGISLAVSLEGEDEDGLSLARIGYRGRNVEEVPKSPSVALDDTFTELDTTDLDATPGQVVFLLRDTAGKETRATVYPDETAPELQTFSVEPTENAGEIAVRLKGRDETGLEHAAVLFGEQTALRENVSGQTEYRTDQRVSVSKPARFKQNSVTASLADWNGNTTETEAETYVRKYDVMTDTRLDVGVNYFTAGEAMFKNCLEPGVETEPEVGADEYGRPIRPETTTKHIDQMQGCGIGRVQFTFEGTRDTKNHLQAFLDSDLVDAIDVEPTYYISGPHRWTEDADFEQIIEEDMEYVKEEFFRRDNAATFNGRPTFYVENAMHWVAERERLLEAWEDLEAFADEIRSRLTLDGTEPFMVAGMGAQGHRYVEEGDYYRHHKELALGFDAVMNLVAAPVFLNDPDGQVGLEETREWLDQNYRGHSAFADENDMEFFPRVIPGFDTRANTCWGNDERIPRDLEFFETNLQMAKEYGTSERLNVFTWNDFTEGTAIEPGTWRGNDYGTAYLERVRKLQRAN